MVGGPDFDSRSGHCYSRAVCCGSCATSSRSAVPTQAEADVKALEGYLEGPKRRCFDGPRVGESRGGGGRGVRKGEQVFVFFLGE